MPNQSIVGSISRNVIQTLHLLCEINSPIYLGKSNLEHMQKRHPEDFQRYGDKISLILASPDYVAVNAKDGSIEYVKEFCINNEFVKVAVRISNSGKYYARSLYVLNSSRVQNFIRKGTLKKI